MVGSEGFEPPKAEPSDLQSDAFDRFANYPMRRVYFSRNLCQSFTIDTSLPRSQSIH